MSEPLTPERIREILADADALAEENETSEFASESDEEILARYCHELAAALAARDRQLAELRKAARQYLPHLPGHIKRCRWHVAPPECNCGYVALIEALALLPTDPTAKEGNDGT